MKRLSRSHAFTLIELLIVIVIIGVLAGVLLAVLRPQEQINRAKDATTKSSLNKIALSIKGNISAYNRVPTGSGMIAGLANATAVDGSGTAVTPPNVTYCSNPAVGGTICQFRITGSTLPQTCATAGSFTYNGDGANPCFYIYYTTDIAGTAFRLVAKSWGSNYIFVYDSTSTGVAQENTWVCPSTYTYTSDPATVGGCTNSAS